MKSASCDGSDPDIVSSDSPSCLLLITELRAEPYSLTLGDVVKAKVQARNVNGWSPLSTVNTVGGQIETEPLQMTAPTNGDGTSQSQVVIDWTALPDLESMGGSEIISHHLMWDQGTNGA